MKKRLSCYFGVSEKSTLFANGNCAAIAVTFVCPVFTTKTFSLRPNASHDVYAHAMSAAAPPLPQYSLKNYAGGCLVA